MASWRQRPRLLGRAHGPDSNSLTCDNATSEPALRSAARAGRGKFSSATKSHAVLTIPKRISGPASLTPAIFYAKKRSMMIRSIKAIGSSRRLLPCCTYGSCKCKPAVTRTTAALRVLGEKRAGLDNAFTAAAELLRIANSGEPGGPGRASASDDARNALPR